MFGSDAHAEPPVPTVDVKTLHAKIGQLTLENDFRPGRGQAFWKVRSASRPIERRAMIDRYHDLPVLRQAQVLNFRRSSVYYQPRPVSPSDQACSSKRDLND